MVEVRYGCHHRCPKLSVREYKDRFVWEDKTRDMRRQLHEKNLNQKAPPYCIMGRFLPIWFFSRLDANWGIISSSVVNGHNKIPILNTEFSRVHQMESNISVKMFPRPGIHCRGQRVFFHFNPLAAKLKPCQRRQAAVSVPNERMKQWKRASRTLKTTQQPLSSVW